MWRALFLALGISLIILGTECLFVEQVEVVKLRPDPKPASGVTSLFQTASYQTGSTRLPTRTFPTKEWMPWSLLAAGAIVVIYTYSIPRRSSE